MGEQGGDQSSCCWMPPTPYRPILTRPETKLRPEISTSSRPLGVEEIQENRLVIDLDPDPAEESGFVYHGAGVGAGSGVETSTDAYFRRVAQWRDVPCKELMILAVASANDGSGSAVLGDTQHPSVSGPTDPRGSVRLDPRASGPLIIRERLDARDFFFIRRNSCIRTSVCGTTRRSL